MGAGCVAMSFAALNKLVLNACNILFVDVCVCLECVVVVVE